MMNKIVGYSGFRTYGELDYPTRKQGKQLELTNKVWQATRRIQDDQPTLQNYQNFKTGYKKSYLQNTHPKDYHIQHVQKGGIQTLNYSKASTIPAYDEIQANKLKKNQDQRNQKYKMLQTGTEHWKTNYQQQVEEQKNQMLKSRPNSDGWMNKSNSLSKKIPSAFHAYGDGKNSSNNDEKNNNLNNDLRSQSMKHKFVPKMSQEQMLAKKQSYKNRPYINNCKMGTTEYKFNYGEKIGSSPFDLLNRVSLRQPLRNNPLKHGTNQHWTEIPCYQGFKPSEIPFKDLQKRIENRKNQNRGDFKLNLADNYHVQNPGYAGFKPQYTKTQSAFRTSCLSYK